MAAQYSPTKTFHKTTYASLNPTRAELSAGNGKTIVITGGGTGIGAETAKYFAKAGASHVAILGRREQPLLDTKAALEAEFPDTEFTAISTDITKESQVNAAFEQIATNGKIDVLCSNAATLGAIGPVAKLTSDTWVEGVFTNIGGSFNVAKAFLEHGAKDGVIIDVNSVAAHMDLAPGFSAYSVSKMATARFYQYAQFENPELSIFSIHPGAVATDMSRASGYKPRTEGEDTHDDANLPASFMVWLASPEARFLKGKYLWANWDVDELKARANEIETTPFLSVGLYGWPILGPKE
ncbi:oxidoreductase [Phaeosphaeriaceae sp. PMI808]|nr:oxidoreductase [Phaeosphaeriaceae sp. PMI808]